MNCCSIRGYYSFEVEGYKGLDNILKRDKKRKNKFNKIIRKLSDLKFDKIITESMLIIFKGKEKY